jgi:hypothetical protein
VHPDRLPFNTKLENLLSRSPFFCGSFHENYAVDIRLLKMEQSRPHEMSDTKHPLAWGSTSEDGTHLICTIEKG